MIKRILDKFGINLATGGKFCEEDILVEMDAESKENLIPENIVKGKTILRVEGTALPLSQIADTESNITEITAEDLHGVVSLNATFSNNSSIQRVTLPDSCVNIVDRAFQNCSGLYYIDLNDGLTYIASSVFENCPKLDYVHIPSTVNRISHDAFRTGCDIEIIMSSTEPPFISPTAFDTEKGLTIFVPTGCVDVYKNDENWQSFADFIFEVISVG